MSVILNGTNQFLDVATPKAAYPFSMSFWFKTADVDQGVKAIVSNDSGTSNSQNTAQLRSDAANDPIAAASYLSSWQLAYSVSPFPQNDTWHHGLVVFAGINDRRVLLDGASKGTNVGGQSAQSNNYVSIGARFRSSPSLHFAGNIAEVAFYGSAVSDANAILLAGGTNPQDVDAGNLLDYWTLFDDNTTEVGGTNLTENNSPSYASGDHPTIDLPSGPTSIEATLSGEGSMIILPRITVHQGATTLSGVGGIIVVPSVSNFFHMGSLQALPLTPIQPGWDPGCNNGANKDWSIMVPRIMDTPIGDGDHEQNEPAAADENQFNGAGIVDNIETPWFEIAHLLPRIVQDVGNLVTEQTIQCELYNADRQEPITVASITDNLGVGFTVVGVPTAPFNIASQDGLSFTIKVLQQGDLVIDGDYGFTLSTGETYTVYIIGSRIVLFPIRPEAPLKEHLIWQTKILPATSAGEQRIANRAVPRGVFEFRIKEDRKQAETILFDRQAKLLAVPAWHEPAYLTSAGAIDDLTINVGTTAYSNFYVGGYAVVFTDKYNLDALKIDSLTATTITFESGLATAHVVNTQVMPLMTGFAAPQTPMSKAVYNDQTLNVNFHIDPTPNDIADDSAFSTYNSKTFFDDPNYLPGSQIQEALRTKVYVLDNSYGDRTQFALQTRALRHSRKGFKTNTRQAAWELRQMLHFLRGRQVSFYIPTFSKDLVPNTTLIVSNSVFTMDNIGYTNNVNDRWPRQVFRMHLKDGTILTRTIQNSSEVSLSEEQLTVDTVWPYNIEPADIERCEFIEKARFDTDDIVINHITANGVAYCTVPTLEVTEDDV